MPRKGRSKSRSRSRKRRSPSRGWRKSSPKRTSSRRALYKRCGSRCFLQPKQLKYPICSRSSSSCSPDCRGLLAAVVRSRQYNRAPGVTRRARSIAKRKRCSWVH